MLTGKHTYLIPACLSILPYALIPVLEANLDKVNWINLSRNPTAIHILEENLDKVDWFSLSTNPAAIHLLETNLDKINWYLLSGNPALFYEPIMW